MGEKNIDRLFQKKFKDFEDLPEEKVWHAIEASLNKKRRSRKIIPLWWKLGGVAAVLAILFYIFNPYAEKNDGNKPVITDVEKTKAPTDLKNNEVNKPAILGTDNRTVVSSEEKDQHGRSSDQNEILGKRKASPSNTKNRVLATAPSERNKRKNTVVDNSVTQNGGAITKKMAANTVSEPMGGHHQNNTNPISESNTSIAHIEKDKMDVVSDKGKERENILGRNDPKEVAADEGIAKVDTLSEKKSIFEEIEKDKEKVATSETKDKWEVGPSIAPVYFNSLGEGSPIHSNFASNPKSGSVHMSYGMVVSYGINKKLRIRSGVHKVAYGYTTNEISFSPSFDGASSALLKNINYALTSENVRVESQNKKSIQGVADIAAKNTSRNGTMMQQFGYLEVPVELNYTLLDKKFGINLIGGVSSLFLTDNDITVESGGLTTEVGKANNINTLNFSTNIGFGLNYKFTRGIQLNIEPMFKYQLNTFSDSSGNFEPYSIGVYSGIRFKF